MKKQKAISLMLACLMFSSLAASCSGTGSASRGLSSTGSSYGYGQYEGPYGEVPGVGNYGIYEGPYGSNPSAGSGNYGQYEGSYGTGSGYGAYEGNYGTTPGTSGGNYGQYEGSYGSVPGVGNYGQYEGNYGSTPSMNGGGYSQYEGTQGATSTNPNYGQYEGNYGTTPGVGNYGQYEGNYGSAPNAATGNYGRYESSLGTIGGINNGNYSQYEGAPSTSTGGNYSQYEGDYNYSSGITNNYGQYEGNYGSLPGSTSSNYGQYEGNYGSLPSTSSGNYGQYEGNHGYVSNATGNYGQYESTSSGGTTSGSATDYEKDATTSTTGNLNQYEQIGTGGASGSGGTAGDLSDFESSIDTSYQGETTWIKDDWRSVQGYNYFYFTQLGDDVMPIGAWCAPPPASNGFTTNQITLDNYRTLAASGINAIYGLYDRAQAPSYTNVLAALDHCNTVNQESIDAGGKAKLVYMVKDSSAYGTAMLDGVEGLDTYYAYMSQPAYGGTLFVDEPGYIDFANIGAGTKEWKKHDLFGQTKLALVNNLPTYASAAQLYYGAATQESSAPIDYKTNYDQWLTGYMQMVSPQVFSYDFYPFNGSNTSFTSGYYDNMSLVRMVCTQYNVPFWTFEQVGAWSGGRTFSYAEIAFQAHASLAYGAKGIQWFNYWQPLEFAAQYVNGLVDHYGNKTTYYNYVQKVNRQIAAVDHVLMKSASKGIIQIGNSLGGNIPSRDKVSAYGALSSTSGSSGDAIVGCFEYRDQGYAYYIASNSTTAAATVKLTFNTSYSIEKIQDATSSTSTGSSITVSVPAGEGVLVVVK